MIAKLHEPHHIAFPDFTQRQKHPGVHLPPTVCVPERQAREERQLRTAAFVTAEGRVTDDFD